MRTPKSKTETVVRTPRKSPKGSKDPWHNYLNNLTATEGRHCDCEDFPCCGH